MSVFSVSSWPVEVVSALIAAAVALVTSILAQPLRFLADRTLYRGQINAQYRHGRLKEIKQVIGEHLGPLLEEAEAFDHRMINLYSNPSNRSWLAVGGSYRSDSYFIDSTVRRFLAVVVTIRRFESRALHVDPTIVRKADFEFVSYCKLMRWSLTGVGLFEGEIYKSDVAKDHFFSDDLRSIADQVMDMGLSALFENKRDTEIDSKLWGVWTFFDGIDPNEDRLRWDRLVSFHLVLMMFLRTYGYSIQRPDRKRFKETVSQLRNPAIAINLKTWARRHGVKRSMRHLLGGRMMVRTRQRSNIQSREQRSTGS